MSEPKLYMMCGVSGSGKTTFAKNFALAHSLRYLNPDYFYALYNGDERNHYNEFEIWMALFRALHMAEQEGVSVMFDTNAPTLVDRSQILDWFPKFEHHLICVTAPAEVFKQNNKSRYRVVPDDVLADMMRDFQMPDTETEGRRWQSITYLRNEYNNGFSLLSRFLRSNDIDPPVTDMDIDYINLVIPSGHKG